MVNLLIAWLPKHRGRQGLDGHGMNLNGETEPRFLICTTAERCHKQAAKWILEDADNNLQLMSDEGLAEITQAVIGEDWENVVKIYNKKSRSGWYIHMPSDEVPVYDWDPGMEGLVPEGPQYERARARRTGD